MASAVIEMSSEQLTQMNTYRSYVNLLLDPNAREENKLKAVQELSEDLEVCVFSEESLVLWLIPMLFSIVSDDCQFPTISAIPRAGDDCLHQNPIRRRTTIHCRT